jgi:predicted small integral membrane protein
MPVTVEIASCSHHVGLLCFDTTRCERAISVNTVAWLNMRLLSSGGPGIITAHALVEIKA